VNFSRYLVPFLSGVPCEDIVGSGRSDGSFSTLVYGRLFRCFFFEVFFFGKYFLLTSRWWIAVAALPQLQSVVISWSFCSLPLVLPPKPKFDRFVSFNYETRTPFPLFFSPPPVARGFFPPHSQLFTLFFFRVFPFSSPHRFFKISRILLRAIRRGAFLLCQEWPLFPQRRFFLSDFPTSLFSCLSCSRSI